MHTHINWTLRGHVPMCAPRSEATALAKMPDSPSSLQPVNRYSDPSPHRLVFLVPECQRRNYTAQCLLLAALFAHR